MVDHTALIGSSPPSGDPREGTLGKALIFLDVDGVLNSMRSITAYRDCRADHLDRVGVLLLDRLCGALTEAGWAPEIVISSTWRLMYPAMGWWRALWERYECKHIVMRGKTPDFHDNGPNRRGREVAEWLRAFQGSHCGAPYVCLDDDSDFLPGQPLVWVDPDVGLQVADIDAAFRLLTGKPMPGIPRIIGPAPEPLADGLLRATKAASNASGTTP
jgi:hypothetical protein